MTNGKQRLVILDAEMSHESGLTLDSVSHAYGQTTVLRDASLTARPGEIHCLLGPSGSGKTTLLRLVAGLERLQAGRIIAFGRELAGASHHVEPEERSVGFVFQDYALFPHLSVRDNVLFGISNRPRDEQIERMRSLLASVRMSQFEREMPHTLSGGEQQRIALIRALGRDPAVMLLDEPFSGLDEQLRDEVRKTTVEVLKSAAVATLLVTHSPEEALMIGDAISIIRDGRLEQTGTPYELYSRPANERVAKVFGEVNRFDNTVVDGQVSTPIGTVRAPSFSDGEHVVVLLRPESVTVSSVPSVESVSAVIQVARLIGGRIHLEVRTSSGCRMAAIVPPSDSVRVDATVHLSLGDSPPIVLPREMG